MAKQLDAACNRQSPSNSWARGSGGRLLPSDLINPLFERDFPAEVNERADYNDPATDAQFASVAACSPYGQINLPDRNSRLDYVDFCALSSLMASRNSAARS
jgi:hypothetical protein